MRTGITMNVFENLFLITTNYAFALLLPLFFFAIKYIAHKINDSGASGKCVIVVPRVRALINLPKE
jgi:hypothetical protein